MINEISERLTTQGGTSQTFTSPAGDITFYHTSFLSSSAAGLIQTWHLMLITCQTKDLPKNLNPPYNTLTQQERRIVYYLASSAPILPTFIRSLRSTTRWTCSCISSPSSRTRQPRPDGPQNGQTARSLPETGRLLIF